MLDMLTYGGFSTIIAAITGLSIYAKAHGIGGSK